MASDRKQPEQMDALELCREVERYEFEHQGGPLHLAVPWIELRKRIEALMAAASKPGRP